MSDKNLIKLLVLLVTVSTFKLCNSGRFGGGFSRGGSSFRHHSFSSPSFSHNTPTYRRQSLPNIRNVPPPPRYGPVPHGSSPSFRTAPVAFPSSHSSHDVRPRPQTPNLPSPRNFPPPKNIPPPRGPTGPISSAGPITGPSFRRHSFAAPSPPHDTPSFRRHSSPNIPSRFAPPPIPSPSSPTSHDFRPRPLSPNSPFAPPRDPTRQISSPVYQSKPVSNKIPIPPPLPPKGPIRPVVPIKKPKPTPSSLYPIVHIKEPIPPAIEKKIPIPPPLPPTGPIRPVVPIKKPKPTPSSLYPIVHIKEPIPPAIEKKIPIPPPLPPSKSVPPWVPIKKPKPTPSSLYPIVHIKEPIPPAIEKKIPIPPPLPPSESVHPMVPIKKPKPTPSSLYPIVHIKEPNQPRPNHSPKPSNQNNDSPSQHTSDSKVPPPRPSSAKNKPVASPESRISKGSRIPSRSDKSDTISLASEKSSTSRKSSASESSPDSEKGSASKKSSTSENTSASGKSSTAKKSSASESSSASEKRSASKKSSTEEHSSDSESSPDSEGSSSSDTKSSESNRKSKKKSKDKKDPPDAPDGKSEGGDSSAPDGDAPDSDSSSDNSDSGSSGNTEDGTYLNCTTLGNRFYASQFTTNEKILNCTKLSKSFSKSQQFGRPRFISGARFNSNEKNFRDAKTPTINNISDTAVRQIYKPTNTNSNLKHNELNIKPKAININWNKPDGTNMYPVLSSLPGSYPTYLYRPQDTGSTILGEHLGSSLGSLTPPTYSDYRPDLKDHRSFPAHYSVHYYNHNEESANKRAIIGVNMLVACSGDKIKVCPTNTYALCTTLGDIMCVANMSATKPCTDLKQRNCIQTSIPCINKIILECRNKTDKDAIELNAPCLYTTDIVGKRQFSNNSVLLEEITRSANNSHSQITKTLENSTTTLKNNNLDYQNSVPRLSFQQTSTSITKYQVCVVITARPTKREKETKGDITLHEMTKLFAKFAIKVFGF